MTRDLDLGRITTPLKPDLFPSASRAYEVPVLHTIIIIKSDRSYQSMKTLIEVHKEGKYFVAVDLLTNVADQGLSEEVAVQNLKKGLEEHYHLLIELTPRDHKLTYLDIEVDNLVKNSSPVSS
jgi:predicted RNase H-like HicB family nuclease